jgi:predicted  nucleic acid-binding Zn-ribbon protein
MPAPDEIEKRVAALEARLGQVSADVQVAREDAAAARHLAAARDRDIADLTVKVDANRSAINALGEQTRERFDAVDRRFDAVDRRFEAVDRRFDGLEGRFDALEHKVDDGFRRIDEEFRKVDNGFLEMRAKFDMTAAGLERIAKMIEQRGEAG